MSCRLLVTNPRSASTKIGVYQDEKEVFVKTLRYSAEEIEKYDSIYNQFLFRKEIIIKALGENGTDVRTLNVIVGRGGMLKPMEDGTYLISDLMLDDLRVGTQGQHASNLGGITSNGIAKELDIPVYIVGPVIVDELEDLAGTSGAPESPRVSKSHTLNQRTVAKRCGTESRKGYGNLNLIVVCLGGGVLVGVHRGGRATDVNSALDGDGLFSPERAGSVPIGKLVKLHSSGKYTEKEMHSKIVEEDGFAAYLNTSDVRELEDWVNEGREDVVKYYSAFAYQIAKSVGGTAIVLEGKVDRVIVTGGITYWKQPIIDLNIKVGFITPITVYLGEDKLLALAQGTLRILGGEEIAKEYK